ncbi:LPS-assembly protein LptD [Thermaurantiacus sp.]
MPAAEDDELVSFAADELVYLEREDRVIASGNVILRRADQVLTADQILWDRRARTVEAIGQVRIGDSRGNVAVADRLTLGDDLRDGAIANLLVVLADGGRLAARNASRMGTESRLERAIYSPCQVLDDAGCPQQPLWAVRAVRVRHDSAEGRVHYRQARFLVLGVPMIGLPTFSHPDSALRNQSGLLSPDLRISNELGFEVAVPYYWAISPNRDLTTTARIYSRENPLLDLEYRHLLTAGPVRARLAATWSEGRVFNENFQIISSGREALRGLVEANGRVQHQDGWGSTFSARLTNDRTFPGRYELTYDTTLRTTFALERQTNTLYIGARGWYFQDLAPAAVAAEVPTVLPLLDLSWRAPGRPLGGRVRVDANALSLFREDGQDMNRVLAQAQWERLFTTAMGHRVTVSGLVRADGYHVEDSAFADNPAYAGADGLEGRIVPLIAIDWQWPLVGPLGAGTQNLTPRIQFVASTFSGNDKIPNEDSRAIELEDTNLFAFNRFPGFDRWEGGARLAYGLSWDWARPGIALAADIGQSFRFAPQASPFPVGTGLEDRMSDIVGRFTLRAGRFGALTQRIRLDKDDLTVRRSELDLSFGTDRTFATIGYLRFNRDSALEDLADQEELRFGTQVALFRYWSAFASMILDLTSRAEEPTTVNDGFQPIRHRVGFIYTDECFDFRFTWRRNYVDNLNAPRGNSFSFSFRLTNLGR